MTFWTSPDCEPIRKYRYKVNFGAKFFWWAKSVTKPSYEINTNRYTVINHSLEYPGIATWSDVTLVIVDVGSQAKDFMNKLEATGYQNPSKDVAGGIEKGINSDFVIEQVNSEGDTVERWTLYNHLIKSVAFGDLSYEDDGLVEITINISYDWAELEGVASARGAPAGAAPGISTEAQDVGPVGGGSAFDPTGGAVGAGAGAAAGSPRGGGGGLGVVPGPSANTERNTNKKT